MIHLSNFWSSFLFGLMLHHANFCISSFWSHVTPCKLLIISSFWSHVTPCKLLIIIFCLCCGLVIHHSRLIFFVGLMIHHSNCSYNFYSLEKHHAKFSIISFCLAIHLPEGLERPTQLSNVNGLQPLRRHCFSLKWTPPRRNPHAMFNLKKVSVFQKPVSRPSGGHNAEGGGGAYLCKLGPLFLYRLSTRNLSTERTRFQGDPACRRGVCSGQ